MELDLLHDAASDALAIAEVAHVRRGAPRGRGGAATAASCASFSADSSLDGDADAATPGNDAATSSDASRANDAASDARADHQRFIFLAEPVYGDFAADAGAGKAQATADALCARAAGAPGASALLANRRWKAWLSTSSATAPNVVTNISQFEWINLHGKKAFAAGTTPLMQAPGGPLYKAGGDEYGGSVWTGTSRGGALTADCGEWTSQAESGG